MILTALSVYVLVKLRDAEALCSNFPCTGNVPQHSGNNYLGALVYQTFRLSPQLIKNAAAASALVGFITHLVIDENVFLCQF